VSTKQFIRTRAHLLENDRILLVFLDTVGDTEQSTPKR